MAKTQKHSKFRRAQKGRLGLWTTVALLVLVSAYLGVLELSRPHVSGDRLRIDSFVEMVESGRIKTATILDEDAYIVGNYVPNGASPTPSQQPGGAAFDAQHGAGLSAEGQLAGTAPADGPLRSYSSPLVRSYQAEIVGFLVKNRVPTTVDQQVSKRVASLALYMLPGLAFILLLVYLLLSRRRGTGLFAVSSGARRIRPEDSAVGFADVAGQDAAVAELRQIKAYLTDPERFASVGAPIPKGILLFGPPGCGKTLLARALASEAGASFYSMSGSDFVEMYVGVGAARVRDLFKNARENAPAIVFIDELDSIGRARGIVGTVQAHGEQEQALNQILAEMDGFSVSDGILVLGATNRPDVLDQALLRPGRFDQSIGLERPDEPARLAILSLHAKSKRLAVDVDLATIAGRAYGMTGADLANVLNEGARLAVRAGRTSVSQADLREALRRILDAPERQRRLALRERSIGRRSGTEERATFSDVAGADDAVAELAEVKEYLADPDRFAAMGARIPRGILMVGPPGCGKTLLARAVAGEANAAFFSVAASEFEERFVGIGASRVRDLFSEARSVAPAIVFIDEIDSVGSHRSMVEADSQQTLNQILIELDGFEARSAVIVMAATNRPDLLDAALVRPGRFDRRVAVTIPDRSGRAAILALHSRGKPLAVDVDLETVAGLTRGFSGADLANVLNEAALLATRRGERVVTMSSVEEGIDRAILGVSSGTVMSPQERRMVAFHEAGHALVAMALPHAEPPHKLTIAPRGPTLGHCKTLGAHDRVIQSRSMLLDEMAVLLGGQVAEQLVFGETGSGSAADLHQVGDIARRMVREYGMSEAVGALSYPAAGRPGWGMNHAYSEHAARTIDSEVRALANEAQGKARDVLMGSRSFLERVAEALLQRESLSASELEALATVAATRGRVPTASARLPTS